jgi:serine/threonine protein kinase
LDEQVGRGGSATVYRGTDTILRRQVAVKVFHPDPPDVVLTERRAREMRLAAAASDPHLLAVYDAHLDGPDRPDDAGPCYLVTEFVDGPNLAELVTPQGLPPEDVRRIGVGVAHALAALHERGLVHRDVKPSNVLLTVDHRAKLADLGIARELDGHPVTRDGAVPGTAPYLSPEQAEGKAVGPASDVYSLGLVLLECLTGHREYPGGALESAVARLLRDPVIPPHLPDPWPDALRAMTDRDPNRRPGAAGVAAALAGTGPDLTAPLERSSPPATDGGAPAARMPLDPSRSTIPVQRRSRRRPAWIVAGVLAAVVATGAVVAATTADPDNARQPAPGPTQSSTPAPDDTVPTLMVTAAPPAGTTPSAAVGDPVTTESGGSTPVGQPDPDSAVGGEPDPAPAGATTPPPAETAAPDPITPVDGAGPGNGNGNGTGNGDPNGRGNNGNGNNGNGNGNGNGR